jgi:hypothetical protein
VKTYHPVFTVDWTNPRRTAKSFEMLAGGSVTPAWRGRRNGGMKTLCQGTPVKRIQPGKPMQNGHVESFSGRLRDELSGSAVMG